MSQRQEPATDRKDDDDKVEVEVEVEEIRDILLNQDTMIHRVSLILGEALERQIAHSQTQLAQSFAPVVSESIRYQVYQAREELVDAIYPVVGQAVSKSVSQAVRNLLKQIDARLQENTNPSHAWGRLQARIKGIPPPIYALRGAMPFLVRETFLIQRESGLLISHLPETSETLEDRDLVSGMLTAIRDFARDAFGQGKQGELGAIEYESQNILLEAGTVAYLAVVVEGLETMQFRQQMQSILVELHQKYYDSLANFDDTDEDLTTDARNLLHTLFDPSQESDLKQDGQLLTRSQRLILATLALLLSFLLCLPVALFGWWVWRIETSLAALAETTPHIIEVTAPIPPTMTPTVSPSPTPSPTVTPLPSSTPTPSPTATASSTPTSTATASPTPTSTATPTPRRELAGGVKASILNLRAAPGLESDILLVLSQGDSLTAIGRSADSIWIEVETQSGNRGWVYSPYVEWADDTAPLPDRSQPN